MYVEHLWSSIIIVATFKQRWLHFDVDYNVLILLVARRLAALNGGFITEVQYRLHYFMYHCSVIYLGA